MSNVINPLLTQLSAAKLGAFTSICRTLIQAYDGFPELEPCDYPVRQISVFLDRSQELSQQERAIRLKHELSKLSALRARAYGERMGTIRFFQPLEQTFRQFSESVTNIETYFTVTPYPAEDILMRAIGHSLEQASDTIAAKHSRKTEAR